MSVSRSFNLLQQWRIPSAKLSQGSRRIRRNCSGYHLPRGYFPSCSSICICRQLQRSSCTISSEQATRSDAEITVGTTEKPLKKHELVGAFQKLPMVMPAVDIISSAQRKTRNISPTKGITNIAKRERNRGAKQLDALMKELAVPLRGYVENFPNKRYLHPYERSLIELTLGEGNYEKSSSKREAEECLGEGLKKVEEVFQLGKNAIDDLLYVAKTLRGMPVIDPETPTLCLVGAPNVGKSSLVRILSTGKPEVCNYPFTTRGILMGHIVLNYERFQVTDTPGLLTRHDDDRNNIERLTLAVLSHLPTAILYVHDLSGQCGTSPDDQFITYKEIKEKFGDHLWLDVISKCDLLEESTTCILEDDDDVGRYRKFGPHGAIRVSITSEVGIDELKGRVHQLLISQMDRIKSDQESQETADSS